MDSSKWSRAEPAGKRAHLKALDALRGVCAFLVVLGHSRNLFHLAENSPKGGVGWEEIALVPTAFAKESVGVFFVLSGFLVGGQILILFQSNRFSWVEFLTKRLARLWVVLIPGLTLTAVADPVAKWLNASAYGIFVNGRGSGVVTGICNVLFLNPQLCSNFGSNDSLWSVSNEFWFYILFSAGMMVIFGVRRGLKVQVCVGVALLVGVIAVYGFYPLLLMLSWLYGVGVSGLVRARPGLLCGRYSVPASLALLAAVFVLSSAAGLNEVVQFGVVGVFASVVIVSIVNRPPAGEGHWFVRWLAWVGSWSYSMYVFHLPIITVVVCYVSLRLHEVSLWIDVLVIYTAAGAAALLTYLLSTITERYTGIARSILSRFFQFARLSRPD